MRKHLALGSALALLLTGSAGASSLTPDQLTQAVSVNTTDLFLTYPIGGPLKGIQWSVLTANMQTVLGATYLQVSNNLSDLANVTTARTNLGLGSAAVASTGTSGHFLPFLDAANSFSGDIIESGAAATNRGYYYRTTGLSRWYTFANSTAESGSNVGSDLCVGRYNDAGTFQDCSVLFTRSTGLATFNDGLTVVGTLTGTLTGKLATGRTLAITGDLTWTSPSFDGSANVTAAGTLATVNSNVGSCGTSTAVPAITLNGKGLATACATNAIPTASTSTAGLAPLATSAQTITGTDTTHAVTPAAVGALMSRGYITSLSSSPVVTGGNGISSVSRTSAGLYVVTLSSAMANTNYTVIATSGNATGSEAASEDTGFSRSVTQFGIRVYGGTNSLLDPVSLSLIVVAN